MKILSKIRFIINCEERKGTQLSFQNFLKIASNHYNGSRPVADGSINS